MTQLSSLNNKTSQDWGTLVLFFYIYQKTSLFLLDLLRSPRYT